MYQNVLHRVNENKIDENKVNDKIPDMISKKNAGKTRTAFENIENRANDKNINYQKDELSKKKDNLNIFEDAQKKRKCIKKCETVDECNLNEYSTKIFRYLSHLEESVIPRDYFKIQPIVSPKMRMVLVDWMVQVHLRFNLIQETLFIAVQILDKFLSRVPILREELQLIGITCLLLASKYEEQMIPEINDYVVITDNSCKEIKIKQSECRILTAIGFDLSFPVPLIFLRRINNTCLVTNTSHCLSKYFLEVCVVESTLSTFKPSYVAACCIYLAVIVLKQTEWIDRIVYVSGYKESELLLLVRTIPSMFEKLKELNLSGLYRKYSQKINSYVSNLSELESEDFKQFKYF